MYNIPWVKVNSRLVHDPACEGGSTSLPKGLCETFYKFKIRTKIVSGLKKLLLSELCRNVYRLMAE